MAPCLPYRQDRKTGSLACLVQRESRQGVPSDTRRLCRGPGGIIDEERLEDPRDLAPCPKGITPRGNHCSYRQCRHDSDLRSSLYEWPGEASEREPKVLRFDPKLLGPRLCLLFWVFGEVESLVASDSRAANGRDHNPYGLHRVARRRGRKAGLPPRGHRRLRIQRGDRSKASERHRAEAHRCPRPRDRADPGLTVLADAFPHVSAGQRMPTRPPMR